MPRKKKEEVAEEKKTRHARALSIEGNITTLAKFAGVKAKEYTVLQDERTAINAQMSAIREELKAKGVDKTAFQRAVADSKLDPEVREALDTAYALVREGTGTPIQGELFEQAPELVAEAPKREPEKPKGHGLKVIGVDDDAAGHA